MHMLKAAMAATTVLVASASAHFPGDFRGLPMAPRGTSAPPPLPLVDLADFNVDGGATCTNVTAKLFDGCGNFTCEICNSVAPPSNWHAVCTIAGPGTPAWSKVGTADGNSAQPVLQQALVNLTRQLSTSPSHSDCNCLTVNETVLADCTYAYSYCEYLQPPTNATGANLAVDLRTKIWRQGQLQHVGESRGWQPPFEGYGVDSLFSSVADALADLKSTFPSTVCRSKLPPLVIIPGLTSSAINYRLTKSIPPVWAFWCNHSTDGRWEPLWPLADMTSISSHPSQFICWSADIAVKFDHSTKTFGPLRKGCETELVDFGNFSGITGPGFSGIFEMVGWTAGKDLFAAPFDWRVPSVGQDEFYTKLKALVELASAANGNAKVVLWAFSFGPQYTLSFLHRMTQAWKEQYIAWFVASSPVWGGAPTALTSYVAGYAGGGGGTAAYPNPPAQCAPYKLLEGACYTGPFVAQQVADIAACCQLLARTDGRKLLNFFPGNSTCALLENYVGTEACDGGVLGYPANHVDTAGSVLSASPLNLVRTLAQASPSLMWSFPRAGNMSNTSWTRADVIVKTPSKKYTAFDVAELFADTDQAKNIDLLGYLSSEPDLAALAAPGVDTYVSYGHGLPTLSSIEFATDLKKGEAAPVAIQNYTNEDGDNLVPLRSSLRAGAMWVDGQRKLSKQLVYKGYDGQPHAQCFVDLSSKQTVAPSRECFYDVLSTIVPQSE
jgi:hypothetical protein